jgi:outer membrane protein TolC
MKLGSHIELKAAVILVSFIVSGHAFALQSLDEFLASARTRNFDQRETEENVAQRLAEADQATARLFPVLVARSAYTRNQYEVAPAFPTAAGQPPTIVTITPFNQLDATFQATVPIIDVGAWTRVSGGAASAETAKLRAKATANDVEKNVTRQYFQVLAAEAAVLAANDALHVAEESQKVIGSRGAAGSASELEVERARGQVERARQTVAGAEQGRSLARRQLETLSGLVLRRRELRASACVGVYLAERAIGQLTSDGRSSARARS